MIKNQLPFLEIKSAKFTEEVSEGLGSNSLDKSTEGIRISQESSRSSVDPKVFTLLPLDKGQIRKFSIERDVQDVDSFIKAIDRAEAEIFSQRPLDLDDLITFWKKNGNIASLAKLIEFSISVKLEESDPARCEVFQLTVERAHIGAEMIASAVTFQRKDRVLVPEQYPDTAIRDSSINASNILNEWDHKEIRALLQRPIFNEAIYGAVRFHHRSVREYMNARWLHRLLKEGKSRREIEGLFFKKRYGKLVLVPSLRPILSWLILFDDRIRDKTIQIAPEVCIQGGDPSSLPTDIRKNMLERFCALYANESFRDLSFQLTDVRRFAHPDLDATVNRLLDVYPQNEAIHDLLLRIAWQGELAGCSEKALNYALDSTADIYSRVYGIRVVRVSGTSEHKHKLIGNLLSDPSLKDEYIIGELIDAFSDDGLGISDILLLLKRLERSDRHSQYYIESPLEDFSRHKCPEEEIIEWLKGLFALIKNEPFYERRYFEVSQGFGWLLPYAIISAEKLIRTRVESVFDNKVLEIISLAQAERDFGHHYIGVKHNLDFLVKDWPALNRALFWYDVEKARRYLDRRSETRLTDYWRMTLYHHYWQFKIDDFDSILEDFKTKMHIDNRLVALSLAFTLYKESGRKRSLLIKLKNAVRETPELESTLYEFLHPGPIPEAVKKDRRSVAAFDRQQRRREKKQAEDRIKSIEWLQSHTDVLRDTSIAAEGGVWKATNYLLNELRNKIEDRNRWSIGKWKKLIPKFGQEVAEVLRDGCINYWRKYLPEMRSEGIDNPNRIPGAVIQGLSGLEMEADHINGWPNNLTELEADLACRYAFREMNGFPEWLPKLHSAFPSVVEKRILGEIEWEFSQYVGEGLCHYVLDDVLWQSKWIYPFLSQSILEFLENYEPKHDDTVEKGLTIVLSSPNLDIKGIAMVAKDKVDTPHNDYRQSLWLAAWMQVDARDAIDKLEKVLIDIQTPERATSMAMMFSVSLVGGRREHNTSSYNDYYQPDILLRLIKLLYAHIRREEDINRIGGGTYSPTQRDDAQDARGRLFGSLINLPGKEAYIALLDLSETHPDRRMRNQCSLEAKRRAEKDSEFESWEPPDIGDFAQETEKAPSNHRELYELAISRLLDLKYDLEEGDNSLAGTYIDIPDERRHRIFIGHCLRERARGKYTVTQEEEMADRKEPDLRFHGSGFDGPVPIELKIADNWSGPELFERLNNQLCGQYLRDIRSNNGIFLLALRSETTRWQHPATRKRLDFKGLIARLKEEAAKIVSKNRKIEDLEIIGIDLTQRIKNQKI